MRTWLERPARRIEREVEVNENCAVYKPPRQVPPLELRVGDLIDLEPLMERADLGLDEADQILADSEYAIVQGVENVGGERWNTDRTQRLITVYTDQSNIAVPEKLAVEVHGHDSNYD